MRSMVIGTVALVLAGTVGAGARVSNQQTDRLRESAAVLNEIHGEPAKNMPQDLWGKAQCVIVIPSLKKATFVVGGEYGKGLMSCRHDGSWSAPIFMQIGKGSWGPQIGAQSIDLVLLVMNATGMDKMLGNKVSLGAEASIAAGPVGRDARAATDAQLKAEILSYSRTQGLFAGLNLSGGVVKPDADDNEDLYGKSLSPRDVVMGTGVAAPAVMQPFVAALDTSTK